MPASIFAIGFVVLNCSNEIFIIAVNGAANSIPVTPHSIHQKINAKIMVTGCNPNAFPNNLGSNSIESINSIMLDIDDNIQT